MKYNIQFSTHSDFSYCYINSTQPAGASYLPEGATNFITTIEVALLPEGTWYWRVMASDDDGLSSSYSSATVVNNCHFRIDASPPSAIGDLSATKSTDASTSAVSLSWTAANDSLSGVSYYKVYRSSVSQITNANRGDSTHILLSTSPVGNSCIDVTAEKDRCDRRKRYKILVCCLCRG